MKKLFSMIQGAVWVDGWRKDPDSRQSGDMNTRDAARVLARSGWTDAGERFAGRQRGKGRRGRWLCLAGWWLAALPMLALGDMVESFEYGVPPPGWTKTNLQGGSGWYQLPVGVMPMPGWGNGTSSVPATAYAGTHNAYCSWTTGGGASEGYHNDQWLISPQLTGLTATSTVSYWLRFNFTNFPDTVYFRVSTNGPAPANFTFVPRTNVFARGSWTNQFPPWSNHVVNVGALGIPAGTPIWIAIQEYEWDNTWNGAAVQLDVIQSDLTAPPEARVNPTSLTFTAYYEGSNPGAQTFSVQSVGSSGMSYTRSLAFGAGSTNWLALGGPTSGTLPLQQSQVFTASVSVAGFDPGIYYATNVITIPGATNSPIRIPITFNVIRRPQTISFPHPGAQTTTNQVGLRGTSSSGLPVMFSVYSGPGSLSGATNLSFTGEGTVRVMAWQLGNVYYDMAPCVTNSIAVTKPDAGIAMTNLSYVYDGLPHGATITTEPEGLTVDVTYNGSSDLPVAIGSYALAVAVNDPMYGGTASTTFTITRMPQTLDFPDPGGQWTTHVVGLAATASSGLPVAFSVASGPGTITGGTNLSFTGAGTVNVVASQAGDTNWLPTAATNSIAVAKSTATVALGNLGQTYDGAAKSATATTDPAGLAVEFTYDGSGTAPTDVGSYAVTGTINDAIYQGADTGTLTIAKGTAPVVLGSLAQAYDGAAKPATATTVPAGLAVEFTYDGSTNAPVGMGSYVVTGTVNEANWQGSATGTLAIGKGNASVVLENLAQAYDGAPRHATATTVPAGLIVDFTYDGSTNGPAEVGSYVVTGLVNEVNWQGSATGTLVIGKGLATVILGDLEQSYDGSARIATATTVPGGLTVAITYDGFPTAPTGVGSYAVAGVVDDAVYQGSATGTLVVSKGNQTILNFLPADGTRFELGATASLSAQASSGLLPVTFSNLSPSVALLTGTNIVFTNRGWVRVQAYQAGDESWNAASSLSIWSVGGLISNVVPRVANVGGGIEILVQGVNLGDGGNIATVKLAGVEAMILSQSVDEVRVMVEPAAGAVTGDVVVASGTGAIVVQSNAFEYLWLDAPDLQEPTELRLRSFLASWDLSAGATSHLLDVATDTNFTAYVPGYEGRDMGLATQQRVTGLDEATRHAVRMFAWNADGFSLASPTVWADTPIPTRNDLDGDGKADLMVFPPATGDWQILESGSGQVQVRSSGWSTTLPVPADYDGDGIVDVASYHKYSGKWYIFPSTGGGCRLEVLGGVEQVPVPADYDGDGRADPAVYDRRPGRWSIRGSTAGNYQMTFGSKSWVPVPADFDGDGKADLAIFYPAWGDWYILHSSTGNSTRRHLGWSTTRPVPADFDGDGKADLAVYHSYSGDWYITYSSDLRVRKIHLGWRLTLPVAADYDGDGMADLAVYHVTSGDWYLRYSSDGRVRKPNLGGKKFNPAHLQTLVHDWFALP